MKQLVILVIALLCCCSLAFADELVLNAEVVSAGPVVKTITVSADTLVPTTVEAVFTLEQTVTIGWGLTATTEIAPVAVDAITWKEDGTVTIVTAPFAPNTFHTLTYGVPAAEEHEAEVFAVWTSE